MNSMTWDLLNTHRQKWDQLHLKDLFVKNPKRFEQFSLEAVDILFDFSKQCITEETIQLLCNLATEKELASFRDALFSGELINTSEKRPALHTALRDPTLTPIYVNGQDIKPEIHRVLNKMEMQSDALRTGKYVGATGKKITDIICLGIGGSDLGPEMAYVALQHEKTTDIRLHFVSNVDGKTLEGTFHILNPEETLCIVSSKTFTTVETLLNARTVQQWFKENVSAFAIKQHMWAVTSSPLKAIDFGIDAENVFEFWSWVGGRYSIWSAVGLPLVIILGMPKFKEFLSGAYAMDIHFKAQPFHLNMPVVMALLGIWNINFLGHTTLAIIPYDDALVDFSSYLQQLDMESNGKSIGKNGEYLKHATAPIVWGGVGCNAQHAYMQLLHQGTEIIPVDFLIATKQDSILMPQQELLLASCFSQSKALMEGSREYGCKGNRPSNTLIYPALTPYILGALLALYEHKTFVQGIIWGINSFDQPGVELGKVLTHNILPLLKNPIKSEEKQEKMDSSTIGLIRYYQRNF